MEIQKVAIDLHIHMKIQSQEKDVLSTHICMMGIHFQVFEGEPKLVVIEEDIDDFTNTLWNSLNDDNKVSLFVRYIDIATGEYETRIVNKNK